MDTFENMVYSLRFGLLSSHKHSFGSLKTEASFKIKPSKVEIFLKQFFVYSCETAEMEVLRNADVFTSTCAQQSLFVCT